MAQCTIPAGIPEVPPGGCQANPRIHVEMEGTTAQTILNKNRAGGLPRPDVKTYYKAAVIEREVLSQDRHTDHGDRTESPGANLGVSNQGPRQFSAGRTIFSTSMLGQPDILIQGDSPLPHTIYKS